MRVFQGLALEGSETCGYLHSNGTTYRGLAMHTGFYGPENSFVNESRGLSALEAKTIDLQDVVFMQRGQSAKSCPDHQGCPSHLTDQVGFISRDRLFYAGADIVHIAKIVKEQCVAHDCEVVEEGSHFRFSCTHFTRAYLSLEFEFRVWNIVDTMRCRNVLPDAPDEHSYLVEFHKLGGCSFHWKKLFARLSAAIIDTAGCLVGHGGSTPSTGPNLLDFKVLQFQHESEHLDIEHEQSCISSLLRMLGGPIESQYAAATAIVQSCITKQACDQLFACGFLEVAQKMLHQISRREDFIPAVKVATLRCILLTISTMVSCSKECENAVVQNGLKRQCANILQDCNPTIFTPELKPLVQLALS